MQNKKDSALISAETIAHMFCWSDESVPEAWPGWANWKKVREQMWTAELLPC